MLRNFLHDYQPMLIVAAAVAVLYAGAVAIGLNGAVNVDQILGLVR